MTTNTNTTNATNIAKFVADQIAAGRLDEYDMDKLNSDEGLQIDGCVAWIDERDIVTVWMGNDDDYDMQRLAEVKVDR